MHGIALSRKIVINAEEIAKSEGFSEITEIEAKVGNLRIDDASRLKKEIRRMMADKEIFKNTELEVEKEETVLKCNECGEEWGFSDMKDGIGHSKLHAIQHHPRTLKSYGKCPECGSPDFRIQKGRGAWVENIKGKK